MKGTSSAFAPNVPFGQGKGPVSAVKQTYANTCKRLQMLVARIRFLFVPCFAVSMAG